MKIALSVWNNRVAPVFDVAMQLLVVEIEDGKIIKKEIKKLSTGAFLEKVKMLKDLQVSTLICGAVSRQFRPILDIYGIDVIGFIAGNVEVILQSWLLYEFDETAFAMPGCQKKKNCRSRQQPCCRKKNKNIEAS
jgi:predicted Fe-Mo cluster-binding NifX family protein